MGILLIAITKEGRMTSVLSPPSGGPIVSRIKEHAAYGIGIRVTRHPRMGAVEEPTVPLREPSWNEQPTATRRENAGVYRLLWVNVHGISD